MQEERTTVEQVITPPCIDETPAELGKVDAENQKETIAPESNRD